MKQALPFYFLFLRAVKIQSGWHPKRFQQMLTEAALFVCVSNRLWIAVGCPLLEQALS